MINEQQSKTKHSTWWKRRTRLEKWLLLLFVCFTIAAVIILTVLITKQPEKPCLTSTCVKTAADVWRKIDPTRDPCQDFYQFTCGNFLKTTILPEFETSISSFSIVSDMVDEQLRSLLEQEIEDSDTRSFKLVKAVYQACMNTTEIENNSLREFKNILKKMGGWPVLEGSNWSNESFDLMDTLYKFNEFRFETEMFFEMFVRPDLANSSRSILTIDQPYIPFAKLLTKGLNDSVVQAQLKYMVSVAEAFGANRSSALQEMTDVINIDVMLARIAIRPENRRNSFLEDNKMSVSELQSKFPYFPWLKYINNILNPVTSLSENDTITLAVPVYFQELKMIIRGTPKRSLANYVYWKIVQKAVSYLNDNLRSLQLEFLKVTSGKRERAPRWRECISKAKRLDIAAGARFVRDFFDRESKQIMHEMVKNIQSQLIEGLKGVDWMDDITRQHALEKAKLMDFHIAYPDELLDEREIDIYYKNLTVSPLKYLESMQNVTRFDLQISYADLDKPTNKKDWKNHALAIVTNAFYDESENSIELPASILQGIFFSKDRPHYMNYGAIGYIIGHEITHGFDDEGRQFDKDGNLVDWWQPQTKIAFKSKAQCIIDQYSNITIPNLNININGINTQGENIADNGGIKQAYLAYKKWVKQHGNEARLPGLSYSPEQMFWISVGLTWCDIERKELLRVGLLDRPHSPNYYRVNVPLMNSEAFAKDFQCPLGSPMNPKHKCTVW